MVGSELERREGDGTAPQHLSLWAKIVVGGCVCGA